MVLQCLPLPARDDGCSHRQPNGNHMRTQTAQLQRCSDTYGHASDMLVAAKTERVSAKGGVLSKL